MHTGKYKSFFIEINHKCSKILINREKFQKLTSNENNFPIFEKPLKLKMKNYLFLIITAVFLISCGTSKPVAKRGISTKKVTKTAGLKTLESNFSGNVNSQIKSILNDAEKYLGTPYKYAGNTSAGFDCSGLVCKVFDDNQMKLPRRSEDQSNAGKEINIREAKPGDLVFFATSGGSRVSHVGIVNEIGNDGEITFIHSSTSKGVIISSLNEKYWNNAYLFTRRVL